MTLAFRFLIAISIVAAIAGSAQAQDVYNFYFQKKGKPAVEKPAEPPQPEKEEEEEYVEEIMEVDSDVLLVPDDWKPHQKRYKKVYVKKPKKVYVAQEKVSSVSADSDEPRGKKRDGRGWEGKLGIGSVIAANHFNTPFGGYELTQSTYVLGATYHMSKYFEVNSELHLPNGEAEANGNTWYGDYHADPQFSIGLGVTPIHLNVFGGEFLAIGIDGGVTVGNESSLDQSSNRVYLGPRLSMNFSDSFSLVYTHRANISGDSDFSTNSLALAYRW